MNSTDAAATRFASLQCAAPECTSPRHVDDKPPYRRRWCRIHCRIRDIQIEGAGGADVLLLENYR